MTAALRKGEREGSTGVVGRSPGDVRGMCLGSPLTGCHPFTHPPQDAGFCLEMHEGRCSPAGRTQGSASTRTTHAGILPHVRRASASSVHECLLYSYKADTGEAPRHLGASRALYGSRGVAPRHVSGEQYLRGASHGRARHPSTRVLHSA